MSAELIPLKAGQHSVILVPRATTDLPFFYLTKQKTALGQNIDYEGVDNSGRPMRWKVTPNRDPSIGAPAIEAHEVWMRLVKPAVDWWLNLNNDLYIIPLGKIRECLRTVGWKEGGYEARDLLRALQQIGAAWCVADLWIPTTKTDDAGNTVFAHVNGKFSRMTIYEIGEKHLTEEQLKDGKFNFDFELDDTVYILLNPIEAQIQKSQPQRLIDNQYLFSVKPAARRWYELMSGKIFGVVKNKGTYCEIKYSWYVKHHHTLKRHYERRRVVQQMNEVVKNHLTTGYISKVEYRALKEPDQELDFIVRYYPGEAAKESIARILSHQYNQRRTALKEKISIKEAPQPNTKNDQPAAEQGSEQSPTLFPIERALTDAQTNLTSRLIAEFGITVAKAMDLAKTYPERTHDQLEAWTFRKSKAGNKAGWIIEAIENNYSLPEGYIEAKRKIEERERQEARRWAIDNCALCNESGFRMILATDPRTLQQYEAMKQCTHNPDTESQYTQA